MTIIKCWLFLTVILGFSGFPVLNAAVASPSSSASLLSARLPVEARDDSSQEDDLISTSYVLPNQIFNDGKPYYASKDPISGQLDFNSKKPAGIEPSANEVIDPKEKIVLSSSSPNIHDFLNLPTKYSSSKFVYPLVSSSYANLKYQGSNKNYVTNKKPTSMAAPGTPPPSYHSSNYYSVPTTKLTAVPPTAPGLFGTSSSVKPTTSKRPTTTSTTTTVTTTKTPTTSIVTTTTAQVSNQPPTKYIPPPTRRPLLSLTTSTQPPRFTTATTRKKFVPTKKYSTSPTVSTSTTSMRFPDQTSNKTTAVPRPITNSPFPTPSTMSTTTTVFTTHHPTPSAAIFPTEGTMIPNRFVPSTSQPVVFTEGPTQVTQGTPAPSLNNKQTSNKVTDQNVADVYHSLGQKHMEQKFEQKPSMTLSDLFNTLAEEESAISSNNQGQSAFDSQGNLIQPISLSKPSPFAMQGSNQQRPDAPPTVPTQDQKVAIGTQHNAYGGEYVSYQVQQPNVMQYRPSPGTINNVVISPGQQSASFVLGSQQKVGETNGIGVSMIEKESPFGKQHPVQYGTVINEDINSVSRPMISNQPPSPGLSNFHQALNIAQTSLPLDIQNIHNTQRPMTAGEASATGNYQGEMPPEPPSPFQQLPILNFNGRPIQLSANQPNSNAPALQPPGTTMHIGGHTPIALAQSGMRVPESITTNDQKNQIELANAQDTKELLVSTNIRFPSNDDQSDDMSGNNPPATPQINGHAQPLSLQQLQSSSNQVIFPKPQTDETYFQGQGTVEDVQIQKHDVVTMNQHKQNLNFHKKQDPVEPSQHMEPPPQRFNTPNGGNAPLVPSNRPHGPPPPPFTYNEFTRKPLQGITRPMPDRHLPNILPQFRPNAKISSGHSPSNYNHEPGNIHITGQPPKRPNSPQFSHRRQPLPQQNRYPLKRVSDFSAGPPPPPPAPHHSSHLHEPNRRLYRLPSYGGQGMQYPERMYPRHPMPHSLRPGPNHIMERYSSAALSNLDTYKTLPDDTSMSPERLAAFEEEDLAINDPPQPLTANKDQKSIDTAKLEPVVTLQMLQSQKKSSSPTDKVPADKGNQVLPEDKNSVDPNELYVVYPMKKDTVENTLDSTETKDVLPAIAHIESPSGSEYQNTPFSVVREQPQEPILMVKHKKPQSLQQQTKTHMSKDKFPYPIEKPDPSFSELNSHIDRNAGVLISSRITNSAANSVTQSPSKAPIAYAYTPTERQHPGHRYANNQQLADKFSQVNLATPVISEIRTNSQVEETLNNNDFDLRGQNLEKDFMAPFYPSVSLGSVTPSPSSGWNILPSTSTAKYVFEKNNINRADVSDNADTALPEATTKSFELDSFQPELQGGFKPIYPPGYSINDDHSSADESMSVHETNNLPLALASHMNPIKLNISNSSTSSTTTSTTTVLPTTHLIMSSTSSKPAPKSPASNITDLPKDETISTTVVPIEKTTPTLRKKTVFETSLEALLFGDYDDVGDIKNDDQKEVTKTLKEPRSVPRMGPRHLKLH